MSNETDVKEAEIVDEKVIEAAGPTASEPVISEPVTEPMKVVEGEVTIHVSGEKFHVSHPQNLLIALAIIDAGRIFIEMQYADALKAAQKKQPTIVRPTDMGDMMRRLSKPS